MRRQQVERAEVIHRFIKRATAETGAEGLACFAQLTKCERARFPRNARWRELKVLAMGICKQHFQFLLLN